MNSHQIGHTVFYHPWQQTTAVLRLAELRMTSNLQTSSQIYHTGQWVWGWIFFGLGFICCFVFHFSFSFLARRLIIQKVCTWLGVNLQIYGGGNHMSRLHGLNTCSRTCQCVWSSYMPLSLLLGIFFFFHIDLLPPSDSSYFLYHMTTHCSISPLLALSIALSLSLRLIHAVHQSLKSKSFCQTIFGHLDKTLQKVWLYNWSTNFKAHHCSYELRAQMVREIVYFSL